MTRIGVLSLQGDFAEHKSALERAGAQAVEIRLPYQLEGIDGLIIPGGESTTLRKLSDAYGLMEPLREYAKVRPTWGTCAGAIFLAREIEGQDPHLGVMNIKVRRNAFGRQIDSFVANLDINGGNYPAMFIRAPLILSVGSNVNTIAKLNDGRIVAAQQDHLLATAFHPELTDDLRFHTLFIEMAKTKSYPHLT
ncbi:MAG: pyridoxal 5'-phosphate synthase glutaminase subunit PdxT [Anaerolineae bacterium]|nr:pyridoxal 5'-phosphate synthase glutaminase subunit PdxT [Anaerolineae bacterium]